MRDFLVNSVESKGTKPRVLSYDRGFVTLSSNLSRWRFKEFTVIPAMSVKVQRM